MPNQITARRVIGLFFRSLLWSLNVGLALYTLLLYWLLYAIPVQHWSASMLMITLPLAWLFNLMGVGFWLLINPWRSILSGLVLLSGFWLWPRTLVWNLPDTDKTNRPTLRLLSYNVANFNANALYGKTKRPWRVQQLTDWVVQQDASVKCFQEFYNSKRHASLDMANRLRKAGYRYEAVLYPEFEGVPDYFVGVAIFSKFPIVRHGREPFGLHAHNGIVWADIRVGSDTVRIINVHLESMGIRIRRVLSQQEIAGVRAETRGILAQLREGFIARQQQTKQVLQQVERSPYPVIVTGDFNDTPYSVAYGRLRMRLPNAFEDAGQGFGFSLNRAPSLLRIDNQFYDATRLNALRFQTLRNIPYSDHFPILGEYRVKGE